MRCRRRPSRARTGRRGTICWLCSPRTVTSSPAGLGTINQLLHEPELRAIFADAVVGPRLGIIESILLAGATNGEIDATTLTPYTARVGTALINQQVLLTGAPPNKRQLAQIVDTVFAHSTSD
jgi:hypothetical protein